MSQIVARILPNSGAIAHELLELTVEVLELAPVVGLDIAARVLLKVWDALQLVNVSLCLVAHGEHSQKANFPTDKQSRMSPPDGTMCENSYIGMRRGGTRWDRSRDSTTNTAYPSCRVSTSTAPLFPLNPTLELEHTTRSTRSSGNTRNVPLSSGIFIAGQFNGRSLNTSLTWTRSSICSTSVPSNSESCTPTNANFVEHDTSPHISARNAGQESN